MHLHGVTGSAGATPWLEEELAAHVKAFLDAFGAGQRPRVFFSPGRVNLFGAHLDYNGGPVMPTAIDRGTFLAVRRRRDRRVRLASTLDGASFDFQLDSLPGEPLGSWVDYPLGVLTDLGLLAGQRACGIEVLFGGNLPIGAGLSSSASICVGMAYLLDHLWELGLETLERVRAALRAERGFVGVHCGIMDPFAVGLARPGHLLWLDCRDESWTHLPLDFESVSIGVADTGVRRELAQGEFNLRVAECNEAFDKLRDDVPDALCLRDVPMEVLEARQAELAPSIARRAEHVLAEVARAFAARDALLAGDVAQMGALMTRTHCSLRELFEVSCEELDVLVDAAEESEGAFGARLTGAGFGGCVVMLLRRGAEEGVLELVSARFAERFGRRPTIELFGGDEGPREIRGG